MQVHGGRINTGTWIRPAESDWGPGDMSVLCPKAVCWDRWCHCTALMQLRAYVNAFEATRIILDLAWRHWTVCRSSKVGLTCARPRRSGHVNVICM
jgi:hypothetical protein